MKNKDREFFDIFENFAFNEVAKEKIIEVPENLRFMAVLAALIGCGGTDAYMQILPAALDNGLSPAEIKEIVYQSAAYVGYGRMLPFLNATNKVFEEKSVHLPEEIRSTVPQNLRTEKGADAQAEIFGEHMKEAWKNGLVNRWLACNCFGDYYTRKGLSLAQRELITFCFLMAQGGCEPQLIAHAKGNMNMGNDEQFLIKIIMHCLPYIGYPRSLNAVECVHKAMES